MAVSGGVNKFRAIFLVRTAVAAVVLTLFLYFYSGMSAGVEIFGRILNWQFSASAVGVGIASGAVVIFLLLSLVIGRVFCSVFCPMGALQEFLWRASAKLKIARKKYVSPWKIRYVVAAGAAIGIIALSPQMFIIPDPISNFGRGVTQLFLMARGEISFLSVAVVGFFFVIVISSCFRGRRFCDWCPVGTVLGFASVVALTRFVIDEDKCVSCGLCEKACPMNCVDAKGKKIDAGRCVLCAGCAASCPGNFIRLGSSRAGIVPGGRRNFIKWACAFIIGAGYLGGRNVRDFMRIHGIETPQLPDGWSETLPPGALDAEHYSSRCVGCLACANACPVGIIRSADSLQPRLVYGTDYCQFSCVECGKVCPTNAITRLDVDTKHRTRIALSRIALSRCVVVTKSQACGACAEVCPTHALSMARYEGHQGLTIPSFEEEYCIGCGACLSVCPADPNAFEVTGVPVHTLTPGLREVSGETDRNAVSPMTADDDFPF
jgi:ferredoxin-type protein NapF